MPGGTNFSMYATDPPISRSRSNFCFGYARAARAALENLARTLSVEWARHEITAVALWPGQHTTDAEVAELACFLLSPAGGYFSGCRFELGAVPVAAR